MVVWIQNPFDNLPSEGFRKMRYALMAEAFVRQGHEVVLWTSDFSHAIKAKRTPPSAAGSPYEVRLVPTLPYSRNISLRRVLSHLLYARAWKRLAARETRRPDLIISSFPTISGAFAAVRLARDFGVRSVVDVQDAWPETFERILPRFALTPLRLWAQRIFRAADFVTGVCERYRALTGRSDYYRAYLGIELGPPPAPRSSAAGDRLRLAYVGGLGRSYDLKTVRAAAARLDAELVIAGGANYLGAEELAAMLATCDVGVIPMADSSWVGLPNKLFDYARAGLPVVSSLTGESAELLRAYGCGATFREGDIDSLVSSIQQARCLRRANARRLSEEKFDSDRIYVNYVQHLLRA